MSEAEIQQLLQNQTQTLPGTSSILESALEPLMPLLSLLFTVTIGLSAIVVLYFIINIIQKQRQHKAILRIDQNLQKLVDARFPEQKPEPTTEPVSQ
jgi:hypothetical protein